MCQKTKMEKVPIKFCEKKRKMTIKYFFVDFYKKKLKEEKLRNNQKNNTERNRQKQILTNPQ